MGYRRGPREDPLPRVPPALPKRAYDLTVEETAVVVDADVKRQLAPRKPEPKKKIDAQSIKWAKNFIEQPSQFEINKPDNYLRYMRRASSHTTRSSSASGKRDVAQLGE